jgi:hypothetical protein
MAVGDKLVTLATETDVPLLRSVFSLSDNRWIAMDSRGDPWRAFSVVVDQWLLAWEGGPDGVDFGHGWRFDLATYRAAPISPRGAPSPRSGFASAAVGRQFVVWGGKSFDIQPADLGDGAVYDPLVDRWTSMSAAGAPSPRRSPVSCAIRDGLLVLGGKAFGNQPLAPAHELGDGAIYRVATGRWTAIETYGAPAGRDLNDPETLSVCVGHGLVVIGRDSRRFDPDANRWTPLDPLPAGGMRVLGDGKLAFVFGGLVGPDSPRGARSVTVASPERNLRCSIALQQIPFFAPRKGYDSGFLQLQAAGNELVFWGRFDQARCTGDPLACDMAHRDLVTSDGGVILTVPSWP